MVPTLTTRPLSGYMCFVHVTISMCLCLRVYVHLTVCPSDHLTVSMLIWQCLCECFHVTMIMLMWLSMSIWLYMFMWQCLCDYVQVTVSMWLCLCHCFISIFIWQCLFESAYVTAPMWLRTVCWLYNVHMTISLFLSLLFCAYLSSCDSVFMTIYVHVTVSMGLFSYIYTYVTVSIATMPKLLFICGDYFYVPNMIYHSDIQTFPNYKLKKKYHKK